ncbi:hypothetical protein LO80_03310 [Candidatus Francisella endociliophora]|uniref:Uncharacterized protein n=1 Tax=Candidatus Francisella endociliophora TaxID=653937 RepID=A0A097ENE8_9GAMM|nr:hypothetical protein [Francisella sp. FSC1006]AIT09092.1 hypothetical protein LO80_03310 [Francisella sp. FSC1006]
MKYKHIKFEITNHDIYFCYGFKNFKKVQKKLGFNYDVSKYGGATAFNEETKQIVIGVDKYDDIYEVKALIVHELSHCVTVIMESMDSNCDEFRSYVLQWLYIEIMKYFDDLISKGK